MTSMRSNPLLAATAVISVVALLILAVIIVAFFLAGPGDIKFQPPL